MFFFYHDNYIWILCLVLCCNVWFDIMLKEVSGYVNIVWQIKMIKKIKPIFPFPDSCIQYEINPGDLLHQCHQKFI